MTSRRDVLGVSAAALVGTAIADRAAGSEGPPKTILMLGGTGLLGPRAVEAALRRGHKVTLFNRGKTRPGLEKLHGGRDKDDRKAPEGRRRDAVVDTSADGPRRVKKAAAVLGPNIGHYPDAWSIVRLIDGHTTGVLNPLGPDRTSTMGRTLEARKPVAASDATFTGVVAECLEKRRVPARSDMPARIPSGGETAGFAKLSNARAMKPGPTFRPLVATAGATLVRFRTLPEDRRSPLRAGLSPEREAKVLAAWKARAAKP